MKVLIVKISALGDIVHALPVLDYLIHGVDPAMQIDWLLEGSFVPLLTDHPYLHKLWGVDTRKWRRPHSFLETSRDVWRTIRQLRREHYDAVLDLQGNSKSGFFALCSGAPLRYGFDSRSVREWTNLLATNVHIALTASDHHITDRSLRIASRAFPTTYRPVLNGPLGTDRNLQADTQSRIQKLGLGRGKLVLLHAGTTWKTKHLSPIFWTTLLGKFVRHERIHLLLTWGTARELAMARSLRERVRGKVTIWPRTGLREFVALLSRVDLVIGGDTGPVHIAAALGTPTVSLFRATDERRNGPRGKLHIRFQSPLECSPCLLKDCPNDDICGNSIGVQAVYEAALSLLAGNT